MKSKFKPSIHNLIIYLILIFSLLNLINEMATSLNYISILVSIIGLIAVALFFYNNQTFKKLVWVWIVAQVISISQSGVDEHMFPYYHLIYDASQFVKIRLGISLSANNSKLSIDFNALVIAYFILLKMLKTNQHIGKSYQLGLQLDSPLASMYSNPPLALIIDKVNIEGEKNWLLATLSESLQLNDKEYDRILIRVDDTLLSNIIYAVPNDYVFNSKYNLFEDFEAQNYLYIIG